ncbi:ComF family protein [Selenomonas sp. AE3005]|uniref:ComF family protein n=1 Tax=Selenomonas sp. AE3005 TaxID=1485543 RepID=UPI0025DD2607|nr:ComF family protein [Selenomonas sp. AE3005]
MRETLLNFIFPPHCPRCHAYVEERGLWCPHCLQETLKLQRLPLKVPMQKAIAEAWAFGVYRGGLQSIIKALKYRGRRSTLPYIDTLLRTGLADKQLRHILSGVDMAVAVPLYPAKEKQRGFNQAELIFKNFLQAADIPLTRQLVRLRATVSMYQLSEQERRQNLQNAFAVTAAKAVTGKNILLVDDILTTGATLHECAKVLKAAGAGTIYALVLASDHR